MKDGVIAVVAGKEIKQEEFDLFVENLPRTERHICSTRDSRRDCWISIWRCIPFRQMQLSRVWIRLRNLHVFWRIQT